MTGLVCGSLGASRIPDMMAWNIKSKTWGASRNNLMAELIVERLTGAMQDGFKSQAMQHGIDTEPMARAAYAFDKMCEVTETPPILHPKIAGSHASPDGLVGVDGLLEIKCPTSATHIETLLGEPIPDKYLKQMAWQMAVTGRKFCDWVSFDPRMPETMKLFVKRVDRDDKLIAMLEKEVTAFLSELESRLHGLRQAYEKQEAA